MHFTLNPLSTDYRPVLDVLLVVESEQHYTKNPQWQGSGA